MKATEVITRDHRAAEELFEQYKKANKEDRETMAEKIFAALDTHEKMEDDYFYPALKSQMEDDDAFEELEEEQEELKEELEEVKALSGDERDERLKAMMEKVLAHAKKEEEEILSEAEDFLGADKLEELGAKMEPLSAVANAGE